MRGNIVFYDVEEWEEILPEVIAGYSVLLEPRHLAAESASLASNTTVVSVFSSSQVSAEVLAALPSVRHIATRSTGVDHIDLAECARRDITVSNIPNYGERTVAEHTFALILALSRKILYSYDRTRHGNFSRQGLRGFDLEGKTLGIVGCGKIGQKVAEIARAFAMKVIAYDKYPDQALAGRLGLIYVDRLEDLLKQSDVISLHVPLTPATQHLINMNNIESIKQGAIIINTARGGIIQTAAVLHGLDKGILSGVGLDVLEQERYIHEEAEILSSQPADKDLATLLQNHILLHNPKVLLTPHNAFNSEEAVRKILDTTVQNIAAFLRGKPLNLVGSE